MAHRSISAHAKGIEDVHRECADDDHNMFTGFPDISRMAWEFESHHSRIRLYQRAAFGLVRSHFLSGECWPVSLCSEVFRGKFAALGPRWKQSCVPKIGSTDARNQTHV